MKPQISSKLQAYLQDKFGGDLTVKARPNVTDSVEVYQGGEFIGVIYEDIDEGETSYQFQMCIIEEDLD